MMNQAEITSKVRKRKSPGEMGEKSLAMFLNKT